MEKQNLFQKFTGTITFKFLLIGFISLILLIPASWVKHLILERQGRSQEVYQEISSIWGYNQNISGPILTIPYKTWYKTEKGEIVEQIKRAHFLPELLEVKGSLVPEERYRSIFKVIVYQANISIGGNFSAADFNDLGISNSQVLWEEAYLSLGIPDMRGIQNDVSIQWNNKSYSVIPGCKNSDIISSGVHTKIPLSAKNENNNSFHIDLKLNGTGSFNVFPVGKKTNVELNSTWTDPSFEGSFLPYDRQIDENGFTAKWQITHLNRNFPQQWIENDFSLSGSDFGVELITPVDHYQQSFRSVKYAMMFIGLTFLLFLLIEILAGKKIHPVQYVLTGFALIIFYSLLVSFSEQFGFKWAYLTSSLSVIGLISFYIQTNLRKTSLTIISSMVLALLYLFLYIILQLQDFALLFGSIGLFIVLAIFMILTRKINWYKHENQEVTKE
jgi:inner membrane protein